MLRGTGVTSSVIHAAGAPGAGASARPNALVVLVNTKLPTPAATASSSSVSVPVMLVSTKSWRPCEPTCGLCSVAGCSTAPTPARQLRTVSRSAMEPTVVVNGEGSRSRPTTSRPAARSTRTSASPRCPALPVTRTRSPGMRLTLLSAPRSRVAWWDGRVRPHLTIPGKLVPGDKVAVVSPAFAAPGPFPEVHELAMTRLREEIGLEPVEYPTTRQLGASQQARADDLMAAFADPDIKAVLATIGGDDQITVLPFLDFEIVTANPKAFFGYSDNTNLLNWLWYHGVAAYHGGSTMVHLGRPGGLHPVSTASLRAALFDGGDLQLHPVDRFCEVELSWADPPGMRYPAPTSPAPGWVWHQPDRVVSGPTWGGNLEILHWNLAVGRWIRPAVDYAGCVLILETSEELPSSEEVFRMLRNAGERGLLAQFPAVVVATAKATSLDRPVRLDGREPYRTAQRDAVLAAFDAYNPEAMIVFNVDFGHTDPQWVLPYGGALTIDGPARTITASYKLPRRALVEPRGAPG